MKFFTCEHDDKGFLVFSCPADFIRKAGVGI